MGDAPAAAKTPADFLKGIKGRHVIVKLNSGAEYRGAARRQRSVRRPGHGSAPARAPRGPARRSAWRSAPRMRASARRAAPREARSAAPRVAAPLTPSRARPPAQARWRAWTAT
jgi:hypothetical protein